MKDKTNGIGSEKQDREQTNVLKRIDHGNVAVTTHRIAFADPWCGMAALSSVRSSHRALLFQQLEGQKLRNFICIEFSTRNVVWSTWLVRVNHTFSMFHRQKPKSPFRWACTATKSHNCGRAASPGLLELECSST